MLQVALRRFAFNYGGTIEQQIFSVVFGVSLGSVLGAAILCATAKRIENMALSFGAAFGTVLLANLIICAIGALLAYLLGASEVGPELVLMLVPVFFLVQTGVISKRHELPFLKAARIAAVMLAIGLLICVVFGGVAFLGMMGLWLIIAANSR